MEAYYRVTDLPWSLNREQDEKFRQLLRKVAPVVLAFALVIPLLPVSETQVTREAELPPQLAKFIMERKVVPPPVVEPEPEPLREEPRTVEPRPVPEPVVDPAPDRRKAARERARNVGVAAFADELRDLRESVSVDRVASSGLSEGADAKKVERSMINAKSGRASGGINTAALSRDTGGTGLAGRSTTRVAGGRVGGGSGAASGGGGGDGDGRIGSRSREEIELVFDKNKAAIFALYNRALRRDPMLQGKLVLKLTIAPSGEVTHCEVVSSELEASEFERKLVARVKMFNFGAKEVATMTTTKPIDFFPA